MELDFGINTIQLSKALLLLLRMFWVKQLGKSLRVSHLDLILCPQEINCMQLNCHFRITDLSVPLNAQATNSPGTPGIEEKMSITKYGMSWDRRSTRATQAVS